MAHLLSLTESGFLGLSTNLSIITEGGEILDIKNKPRKEEGGLSLVVLPKEEIEPVRLFYYGAGILISSTQHVVYVMVGLRKNQ